MRCHHEIVCVIRCGIVGGRGPRARYFRVSAPVEEGGLLSQRWPSTVLALVAPDFCLPSVKSANASTQRRLCKLDAVQHVLVWFLADLNVVARVVVLAAREVGEVRAEVVMVALVTETRAHCGVHELLIAKVAVEELEGF
jgi:hypothetical protein